ncbi:major facilitator superfamily domain-containing protein [Chytriomyces sp. MP71]|nr:major facilitator superfamily domain-containing protein [Chytriomyces sp. MP71]
MGTSCVFIGMIFGSLGWGIISDLIGRRPAFVLTLTIGGIFGTAATFAPNFLAYCALLGMMGVGVGGNLPVDGSLFLEFVPKERQSLLMTLSLFWPVGAVIGAIFSWWLIPSYSCTIVLLADGSKYCDPATNRGWRYVLAAMGLLTLAMLIARVLFIKMYESPKWLIIAGRKEEAVATLKALAEMNGKTIEVSEDEFPDVIKESPRDTAMRFFRDVKTLFHRSQMRSTILIWLVWMTIAIAYTMFYGFLPTFIRGANLSLAETYRNFFIQTLCGIPGSIAGAYMIDTRIGRKGTMAAGAILTGLSLFLFTTSQNEWVQLFFNCLASFLSNLVYGVIYAYTPEVFTTNVRGTGVGMASCLGRIVGVSAPFISGALISVNANYALYLSAGLFALMGVFAALLPLETRGIAAL